MDLKINNKWFLVSGASSGLGKAIAERLLNENANVVLVARREEKLISIAKKFPGKVKYIAVDISQPESIERIRAIHDINDYAGVLINAGGPPAMSFQETEIKDWDEAYRLLLRWKIQIVKLFLPVFTKINYGRLLFIESFSIKQPVENLVLSNSLRLAVAGMVKTISQEVSGMDITLNILCPGYHDTEALHRIFKKQSEISGITINEAQERLIKNLPMHKLGDPENFASLAAWLLSPYSEYVTGQTFYLDGGIIRSSI